MSSNVPQNRLEKKYNPPDIESEKFLNDDSFVRGLRGPFGSGKTVTCMWDIFFRSCEMPSQADGIRHSRWAIVRNTYPELLTTSLATWRYWFGHISRIRESVPVISYTQFGLPDGTEVDLEVHFIAMDSPDSVKKLKSLDLTGGYLHEASELDKSVLDTMTGRVGRYPAKIDVASYWAGITMDTNPPDDDHWWYHLAEVVRPNNYRFFSQEPAILLQPDGTYAPNPKATYVSIQQKGYLYWLDQVSGKSAEWIKVYLQGEYGHLVTGRPVYPEYNDLAHCAMVPLEPFRTIPLILGFDFGLTPSAIPMQLTPNGRVRVLHELTSENMGVKQFMNEALKPFIAEHYLGMEILVVGDPAGAHQSETDQKTCFEMLRDGGFTVVSAKTNNYLARREAVVHFLSLAVDGRPAFELSPTCVTLRKGFRGGYHYDRVQVVGTEMRFKDEPAKNKYSHPHDALQYGCLYFYSPPSRQTVVIPRFKAKRW